MAAPSSAAKEIVGSVDREVADRAVREAQGRTRFDL
jgi:hypothetical protein